MRGIGKHKIVQILSLPGQRPLVFPSPRRIAYHIRHGGAFHTGGSSRLAWNRANHLRNIASVSITS